MPNEVMKSVPASGDQFGQDDDEFIHPDLLDSELSNIWEHDVDFVSARICSLS